MRALIAIWIAVALWLAPAAAQRRVPAGVVPSIGAIDDHETTIARVPDRDAATIRLGASSSGGSHAVSASDPLWSSARDADGGVVSTHTAPRVESVARPRSRRARLSYDATAPPASLS